MNGHRSWCCPAGEALAGVRANAPNQKGCVALPEVLLPEYTDLPATVQLVLPPTVEGTYNVDFRGTVNGVEEGGTTFQVSQSQGPPRPE